MANITSVDIKGESDPYRTLYVHPEPGFKGVSLEVKAPGGGGGGGERQAAWFPLNENVLPGQRRVVGCVGEGEANALQQ